MTSKTENAKQLMVFATDGQNSILDRRAAFEQADALRKELKVGWTKICGMEAKEVMEMRDDFEAALGAFHLRGLEPTTMSDYYALPVLAKDEDFEMPADELAAQSIRPKETLDLLEGFAAMGWKEVHVPHDHQNDFVPPTVVDPLDISAPPADTDTPKSTEEPPVLTTAERGAIGIMARDLLQTSASYEEIALAIRAKYPAAKTTARSLASVAADMRRDGIPCPSRRKGGK